MRLQRTEAIILHTFPARERDKLVVFLTPEHGKVKGYAYGARSMRTRFGASLEPLAKVRIGYVERESEEIVRIESVDLIRSLFPAQQNLAASVAASYLAETVDTFAQSGDPAELIYRLLDRTTEALLAGASPLRVVAYAEVWMLRLAGVLPSLRNCNACDGPLGRAAAVRFGRAWIRLRELCFRSCPGDRERCRRCAGGDHAIAGCGVCQLLGRAGCVSGSSIAGRVFSAELSGA